MPCMIAIKLIYYIAKQCYIWYHNNYNYYYTTLNIIEFVLTIKVGRQLYIPCTLLSRQKFTIITQTQFTMQRDQLATLPERESRQNMILITHCMVLLSLYTMLCFVRSTSNLSMLFMAPKVKQTHLSIHVCISTQLYTLETQTIMRSYGNIYEQYH